MTRFGRTRPAGAQLFQGDMNRQRNALALVGLLAAAALATENIVVGGDGSGATWQEASASAPIIDFSARTGWIQPRSVAENTNIAAGGSSSAVAG